MSLPSFSISLIVSYKKKSIKIALIPETCGSCTLFLCFECFWVVHFLASSRAFASSFEGGGCSLTDFTSGCRFSISRLMSSTHQMLTPRSSISQLEPLGMGLRSLMWLSNGGEYIRQPNW